MSVCVRILSVWLSRFRQKVDSLDSFQPCADSDGLTFKPFSLRVSVPAVDIVKLRAFKYRYYVIFNCLLSRCYVYVREQMPPKRKSTSSNAKRIAVSRANATPEETEARLTSNRTRASSRRQL